MVSYIQQYFNTSITVLTNQVWKLLIALFKVLNTGAFTVLVSFNSHSICFLFREIFHKQLKDLTIVSIDNRHAGVVSKMRQIFLINFKGQLFYWQFWQNDILTFTSCHWMIGGTMYDSKSNCHISKCWIVWWSTLPSLNFDVLIYVQ